MPRLNTPLKVLMAGLALLCSTGALAARHALLIGVSDYAPSGLRNLPGARQDIVLMKGLLMRRLHFQPAEIRVLLDGEATHSGMERAFADLARAVQPGDSVYIHYSGHGSQTPDFNDTDQERGGVDQTLVGHGARSPGATGLDRYDVLDDEVNRWLAPIAAKAGELVYVADACHSASSTRGPDALVARAVPADPQTGHPHAHDPGARDPLAGAVRIGAARDDESALEVPLDAGGQTSGGVFTWNWARALQQAEPTETWRRVFERASLWVSLDRGTSQQHPQLSGSAADRPLLGGKLDPRPTVGVLEVRGKGVKLDAGRLSGVTVGSRYATAADADAAVVRITATQPSVSQGTLESGSLAPGALLSEREHAYETPPQKLFALLVQDDRDRPLLAQLRKRLDTLRGFVWTDRQSEADLVLAVLRPRRVDGEAKFSQTPRGRETIPVADPQAVPEVWVLTPGEQTLVHERLVTPLAPAAEGIETLARNLERYRRVIELRRLTTTAGDGGDALRVSLIQFETCPPRAAGCIPLPGTQTWYRRLPGTLPIEELGRRSWPKGTLLSFALENRGRRDRYAYLFEIAPDGAIRVIFPRDAMNEDEARLNAGQAIQLVDKKIGLLIDEPGDLSLLMLTTQFRIKPQLLTQSGYEVRGREDRAALNPLEQLLVDAVAGTRSAASLGPGPGPGTWGGALINYHVD